MHFDPVAVRTIRTLRGLSRPELAEAVGLSRRQITYYEAGDYKPTAKSAQRLADALGVPLEWLYCEPDDGAPGAAGLSPERVRELVISSRLRQGLPPRVVDPLILDTVATLLTGRSGDAA